jgi:hypothetical protein
MTSVEWLRKELESMDTKSYDRLIQIEMDRDNFIQICEQANKMFEQQIMKSVYDSMGTNFDPNMGRAELYYNETFKSE